MLRQTQAKIINTKEFTNRLALLSKALEACAQFYEAAGAETKEKTKRLDTREGFGMLLFLPPKPKSTDYALANNIICHRHYRKQLICAQADEQAVNAKVEALEGAIRQAASALREAEHALSKAKQQAFAAGVEEAEGTTVAQAQGAVAERQAALSSLRAELSALSDQAKALRSRITACEQELANLDDERAKKGVGQFRALAEQVRAEQSRVAAESVSRETLPSANTDQDFANNPGCFDDIIGLPLKVKPPTTSDISRLRTDCSNSTILGEFILGNQVIAPDFAAAGFPPCKESLVRDTNPDFIPIIMAAARKRIVELIAIPELDCGAYETDEQRALVVREIAGEIDGPQSAEETVESQSAAPLSLVECILRAASPAESDGASPEPTSNILYETVSGEAFPVMVEEFIKPAVLEGLARFGEPEAQEQFARKLSVLSYNEQRAREACTRAFGDASTDINLLHARRLRARAEIMQLALCAALLGAAGVEAADIDMSQMQGVLTVEPQRIRAKAQPDGRKTQPQALLVEQVPNALGGFSLGRSIVLEEEKPIHIGRAPYGHEGQHIIVPAGHSPVPELANFAASVSRAHALLRCEEGRWWLSDAGSSFGTGICRNNAGESRLLVDDERVELRNGDVIALAPLAQEDGSIRPDPHSGFAYRFEVMG